MIQLIDRTLATQQGQKNDPTRVIPGNEHIWKIPIGVDAAGLKLPPDFDVFGVSCALLDLYEAMLPSARGVVDTALSSNRKEVEEDDYTHFVRVIHDIAQRRTNLGGWMPQIRAHTDGEESRVLEASFIYFKGATVFHELRAILTPGREHFTLLKWEGSWTGQASANACVWRFNLRNYRGHVSVNGESQAEIGQRDPVDEAVDVLEELQHEINQFE